MAVVAEVGVVGLVEIVLDRMQHAGPVGAGQRQELLELVRWRCRSGSSRRASGSQNQSGRA